jgi:Predicted AAA-ATPase/PD-(D/E)XK nuclease superfamily
MTSAPPRPRLPIGISDFRQLRAQGCVYVDKTGFIVEVLESHTEVVLVPRPRRFGKTVNLSTMRYFLEASKEDRSGLFEGLAVWSSAAARAHFQRYPVIWLSFKDVKAGDFEGAFAAIRGEISLAYREHAYLLKEGALEPWEVTGFEQILRAEGPPSLYAGALRDLSSYLARRHGRQVFILIDEYDTPIHNAATPADEHRVLDFFRAFFSGGLKDNPHLFKAVITGILRIAKESLFSALNNLAVYSLLRPECATCFGFTEADVRALAEYAGCAGLLPEIERWYNGYRFGGHVIFNPWSVCSFLDSEDKELRPYWLQTSSNDLVRRLVLAYGLGEGGEMEALLGGGEIDKPIYEGVALRDIAQQPDVVWSFLLFTGYLKAREVREGERGTRAVLAVPNVEVMVLYRTMFRAWLEQGLGGENHVEALHRAILSGDGPACEELLGQLLESLSVHDVARRDGEEEPEVPWTPERIYHVFVVGLLLGLQPRYTVRSNRESGSGRYDVMILPRTPGEPGVVMELKVRSRRRRETMKGAMAAALKQIRDRDYAAELRACGASPIHEMGVVFDGKQVRVEVRAARKGKASS